MAYRIRWGFLAALGATAMLSSTDWWVRASTPQRDAPLPPLQQQPAASATHPADISPVPVRALSAAAADPFEIAVAPPAPAAKATPPAPPPPPPPPPMNWRYFGQMTSPDNKRQIFLTRGDQAIAVEAGQRLDDGFVVDAITADNVRLRHADSGVQFLIGLPE
jgi:hypothetical protein